MLGMSNKSLYLIFILMEILAGIWMFSVMLTSPGADSLMWWLSTGNEASKTKERDLI